MGDANGSGVSMATPTAEGIGGLSPDPHWEGEWVSPSRRRTGSRHNGAERTAEAAAAAMSAPSRLWAARAAAVSRRRFTLALERHYANSIKGSSTPCLCVSCTNPRTPWDLFYISTAAPVRNTQRVEELNSTVSFVKSLWVLPVTTASLVFVWKLFFKTALWTFGNSYFPLVKVFKWIHLLLLWHNPTHKNLLK